MVTSSISIKPYKEESVSLIYNLLFCDDLALYKNDNHDYPWNILFSDKIDEKDLRKIINDEKTESRIKIMAYKELRNLKNTVEKYILLGVIAEVGLSEGLDVLAVYRDKNARYINYTGKITIWESSNSVLDQKINDLFNESETVIKNIGPWEKNRLPQPKTGNVRLTFLVSGSLYFIEGPIEAVAQDFLGGPVFNISAEIMKLLVEKTLNKK